MNETSAKISALREIANEMEKCNKYYEQYENASPENAIVLEHIWMSQEDVVKGMRKLYKVIFGERVPYTRSDIWAIIDNVYRESLTN